MSIQNLFASPLAVMNLPEADNLNNELENDVSALYETVPSTQRSNVNGWHSPNFLFERSELSFKKITGHILAASKMYIAAQEPSPAIGELTVTGNGWININGRGGFNSPHTHVGAHVSGTYYVRNPVGEHERSGMIEFLDPRNDVTGSIFPGVPASRATFRIKATPGTLILFPSYLSHWVYPNDSDERRITLAFNLKLAQL